MQNGKLLLVHGPNLNRLGLRSPEIYGHTSLSQIEELVREMADGFGVATEGFQSNSEGAIIDFLQSYGPSCLGIIINPGALAHYGLSLRDCLEDISRPTIEVHISNVHRREEFRHRLVLSPVVEGQIVGLGMEGYRLAATYLLTRYTSDPGKG